MLVREMFLACSRTLDSASTTEDVPAAVGRNQTRGPFWAQRCVASFFGVRENKDGERASYMGRKRERKRLGVQQRIVKARVGGGVNSSITCNISFHRLAAAKLYCVFSPIEEVHYPRYSVAYSDERLGENPPGFPTR